LAEGHGPGGVAADHLGRLGRRRGSLRRARGLDGQDRVHLGAAHRKVLVLVYADREPGLVGHLNALPFPNGITSTVTLSRPPESSANRTSAWAVARGATAACGAARASCSAAGR